MYFGSFSWIFLEEKTSNRRLVVDLSPLLVLWYPVTAGGLHHGRLHFLM